MNILLKSEDIMREQITTTLCKFGVMDEEILTKISDIIAEDALAQIYPTSQYDWNNHPIILMLLMGIDAQKAFDFYVERTDHG